jgi:hypothetical protein
MPADSASRPFGNRGYAVFLVVVLALGAMATTGLLMARKQPPSEPTAKAGGLPAGEAPSKEVKEFAAKYFKSWPVDQSPELLLVFSGEQHNYEAPCGCTLPQFGGIERRYNFLNDLRKLGLKVVPLDLGDIYAPGRFAEQSKLKYQYLMKALNLMGYDAIAVGQEEFRLPLLEGLANTVLAHNYSFAMLGANILEKENYPGENGSMIKDYRVIEPKNSKVKVGVVGTLGQSVIDEVGKIDRQVKFGNNAKILPEAIAAMKPKKPDVHVLLYQGNEDEAKKLAEVIPDFDVILCRCAGSEPPGVVKQVGNSRIVQVGHKGRWIGVMALFRKADGGFDFRWDLVSMAVEFKTPKEMQTTNSMIKLLEEYTKDVKDKDFLSKFPQVMHPMQAQFWDATDPLKFRFHPSYIGSERCKGCHESEFEVWDSSKHPKGFETLIEHERAKPPHNRQFDTECIVCHTTGFGYQTGYVNEKQTPHLKGVGCENCHGPGSLHAMNPNNKDYYLALTPWKTDRGDSLAKKAVENKVYAMCFKCHDTDNDAHFDFDKRWKAIAHGPSVKKDKPKK